MLLCRLSVFAASFDLEAAEAGVQPGDIEPFVEADLVGSLVEKSLVVADASGSDMRYSLLETIRQYGADRLAELGVSEGDRLRAAHAAYYLDWAEQAAPQLAGPSQVGWMMRLEESYPNLRAASNTPFSARRGRRGALRMFGASRRFWRAPSAHRRRGHRLHRGGARPSPPPMCRRRRGPPPACARRACSAHAT